MSTEQQVVKITIRNPKLNFNAGHFTIFSATDREDLHGHAFFVAGDFYGPIDDAGLAFDYHVVKNVMGELCKELDEKVLLPEDSPHLKLGEDAGYLIAEFAEERIPFLPRDVMTLPIRNVTLEELARYLVERLEQEARIQALNISRFSIEVSTPQGQAATFETIG